MRPSQKFTLGLVLGVCFCLVCMLGISRVAKCTTERCIAKTERSSFSIESDVRWTEKSFEDTTTLLKFKPMVYEVGHGNSSYDNVARFPCVRTTDGLGYHDMEDLMCLPRPSYLSTYKNPCYFTDAGQFVCLPYFMLIGFDKSGTTDFHNRLVQHPLVLKHGGPFGKESYYWSWSRYGLSWIKEDKPMERISSYLIRFAEAALEIRRAENSACQPIVGDGTPMDIWDNRGWQRDPQNRGLTEPRVLTPHHVRHILKDPKFFVLMRNPVERMFTDFLFVRDGTSAEQFDKAVPVAIEKMASCLKVNTTRQCFYSNDNYLHFPMRLHISCYSVFLREWLSVFHRKHFFFLRTEDYHNDVKGSLRDAFAFLGVDTLTDALLTAISEVKEARHTSQRDTAGIMSEKTRAMLTEFYEPCNRDLANLLGDDRYLWRDQ